MNTKTFLLIAIAAAASQVNACTNVSVEGDATYCIDGPICSGSGDAPAGENCPVAGTKASQDCHSALASFLGEGNCVAPQDATCQKIKTGAWGCVFADEEESSSYEETEAPATEYKKAKHAKKAHHKKHHTKNHECTNVSVEGDATYCIDGPICSGSGDAPAGVNCPVAGTKASQDCNSGLDSFLGEGNCVAPQDATCQKIKTGAWGCVFADEEESYDETEAPVTEAPATAYKKSKHAKKSHTKHHDCTDVSVEGGSTQCIQGPVCSGGGNSPAGWNCPSGSICKKLHTGAWGCSIKFHKKAHSKSHQKGCTPVSVEGDHTYCIDGPICSGSGDSPAGWNCPTGSVCKKIKTGAWGCSIWY